MFIASLVVFAKSLAERHSEFQTIKVFKTLMVCMAIIKKGSAVGAFLRCERITTLYKYSTCVLLSKAGTMT